MNDHGYSLAKLHLQISQNRLNALLETRASNRAEEPELLQQIEIAVQNVRKSMDIVEQVSRTLTREQREELFVKLAACDATPEWLSVHDSEAFRSSLMQCG